jgi:hypothetical protein
MVMANPIWDPLGRNGLNLKLCFLCLAEDKEKGNHFCGPHRYASQVNAGVMARRRHYVGYEILRCPRSRKGSAQI